LRRDFVPAAGDDWYRRRQEDSTGKFFRSVADQGPRKGEGGGTRQGLYLLTASGKLLAYRNTFDPQGVKDLIARGLKAWKALGDDERRPRGFSETRQDDPRYFREPPKGGIVLRVHARELDALESGGFCKATGRPPRQDLASLDHVWLRAEEWKEIVSGTKAAGETSPLPEAVALRLARFHLLDNTRGEPNLWQRSEVKRCDVRLRVEKSTQSALVLWLEGEAHLETAKGERGYKPKLRGVIEYDRAQDRLRRFDVAAAGDHWGEGTYTRGARSGPAPFGVAFQLAGGKDPADRIPPQAARDIGGYYGD
jgi:hypothetical protein